MIVGVFSPAINWCAGAEWVAINIINALKEHGHQVIVLSDQILDQKKISRVFGRRVDIDQQIIFPLRFFSSTDFHNIYTDTLRLLVLKSKCDVVIDTATAAVLPGTDVCYFQGSSLLKRIEKLPKLRNKLFFSLYKTYKGFYRDDIKSKLLIANSKFTAHSVQTEFDVTPQILYPSVSNYILNMKGIDLGKPRKNIATTVARISRTKNLQIIPQIAELTSKDMSFIIAGLLDSRKTLNLLLKIIKEHNLSERVKVLVNVKREKLNEILINSKIFLHTSINEPFGISIIEAMALGCIPVVHNSGGPKEFVPSNLRFNNINEAADIVEKASGSWSAKQAKRISKAAERFSENNFSKQFMNILDTHFGGKIRC